MSLSVLILGTDAIAAASPSSAVQLIHACRKLGFSAVVPVSWGEEIIADDVITTCSARSVPQIQCSCPRVRDRLGSSAALIRDSLVVLDAPPIATAKYLRHRGGATPLHITYVGGCPIGSSADIDDHLQPAELLLAFGRSGIELSTQPTVFDDVMPPDMRRFHSQPGGLPDPQRLWEETHFALLTPGFRDLSTSVAQTLLDGGRVLIDLSVASGCACRATLRMQDRPVVPRSTGPILPDRLGNRPP